MKINFNLKGNERKTLVAAISQELEKPSKYLGAPTFAYEIGEYKIDKNGVLEGPDNSGLIADLQGLHSIKAICEEYNDYPDIDQHYQRQYANPNVPVTQEMIKQAEAWMEGKPNFDDLKLSEREELGLGRSRRDPSGEDGMQASDVSESYTYQAELSDPDCPDRMEVFSAKNDEDAIRQAYEFATGEIVLLELFQLDENYNIVRGLDLTSTNPNRLTVEIPINGFTAEKLDNLKKLVNSKAHLLKAALATDKLEIKQTAETLQFPWFKKDEPLTSEEIEAYSTLISLLCKTAINKKRITATEKEADNPKYAMRCFLLSLGFIGDEYKTERKILLSRLEGNTAWKSGKKAEVADNEISE